MTHVYQLLMRLPIITQKKFLICVKLANKLTVIF